MPGHCLCRLQAIGNQTGRNSSCLVRQAGAVGSWSANWPIGGRSRRLASPEARQSAAYVRDELRFDAVVDHKARGLSKALAAACPDGIDVYFETLADRSGRGLGRPEPLRRIPVCGLIAHYNGDAPPSEFCGGDDVDGPPRSLLIRGFITQSRDQHSIEPSSRR